MYIFKNILNGYLFNLALCVLTIRDSLMALVVKNPPANAGDIKDAGAIPGSGRCPGEGTLPLATRMET